MVLLALPNTFTPAVTEQGSYWHGNYCEAPPAVFVLVNQSQNVCFQSICHPSCHPVASESGREAQTRATHGKVADQIPSKACQLYNGRK